MKKGFALFIAMTIEVLLLVMVLCLVLVGLVGVFLPVLPGVLLIGIAAAVYGLMLQSESNRTIRRIHPWLQRLGRRVPMFNLSRYRLNPRTWFRHRPSVSELLHDVLPWSLALFGFDLVLLAGAVLGISVTSVGDFFDPTLVPQFVVPMLGVLLLAELSAVVWFRCGQLIGRRWPSRRVTAASLASAISIFALLLFVVLLAGIASWVAPRSSAALVIGLALLYVAVLAATFKIVIVTFGAASAR